MNDITRTIHQGQDRLVRELRAVVDDTEQLLRHAVHDAGESYGEARIRVEQRLKSAKNELASVERAVVAGIEHTGRAAHRYARRHPLQTIGIGVGVALLAGLWLARR